MITVSTDRAAGHPAALLMHSGTIGDAAWIVLQNCRDIDFLSF